MFSCHAISFKSRLLTLVTEAQDGRSVGVVCLFCAIIVSCFSLPTKSCLIGRISDCYSVVGVDVVVFLFFAFCRGPLLVEDLCVEVNTVKYSLFVPNSKGMYDTI